jgi:mono/diheme cytochrome c family protein
VAVRPDTGEYVWHYQAVPGENWDYTCVQQMTLVDLKIHGVVRKVLLQAPKNGFFYVLDRTNGKLISANNFVPVNWASRVDLKTGRPVEIKDNLYDAVDAKHVYPAHYGGHNWHPMSYSPLTGLVYIPAQEVSWPYSHAATFEPKKMSWNLGFNPNPRMPTVDPPPKKAYLLAWDPVRNAEAWRIDYHSQWNGGVLATAGNLLVQGASDGRFVIYRADNGKELWEAPIQTGAVAGPISYAVDGEQYIAIAAGWAGSMVVTGGDMPIYATPTRILAFKLGGTAKLPQPPPAAPVRIPESNASAEVIAQGAARYGQYCRICHGTGVVSGGMTPDLRFMSAATHEAFKQIVLYGARAKNGMAPFADVLSEADADAIHAFIIDEARKQLQAGDHETH